jgi:hypothetical protein
MEYGMAGDVLETFYPPRHITYDVNAVSSSAEGWRHVPDAATIRSLSVPVFRPQACSWEGLHGRSQKDVVS